MIDARKKKNILSYAIYFAAIPAVIVLGVALFNDGKYNLISMAIALLACVPSFVRFEKGRNTARELVALAVMIALSVVGRVIFAPLPGFKPVTAIVIITGMAFGAQAGFLTGSMSAVVSNFYFGQGPWTPFQMFVWGFIGFLAGVIFRNPDKKPNLILLSLAGVLGGVLFSLMMDVWTTLSWGEFLLSRYIMFVGSSLPFMAIYAVSNVIFLLVLARPLLSKLNRVRVKYGIFPRKTVRTEMSGQEERADGE